MAYIQGEARGQQTLFPSTLDEVIPAEHVCRVIEAFVSRLKMEGLGFVRAEPAETGRPGYAELIRFARQVGLVRGEWVAIDGSRFRAVTSAGAVREQEAVKRYLEQLDDGDKHDEIVIDPSAVASALEKLKNDPEPEARFMRMASGHAPAYNVQTAVDAEHAIIVAHQVTTEATDNRSLLPMAEAAKQALEDAPTLNVVADAGYSNGAQAEECERQGILPHAPANRAVNNQGDGRMFDRSLFIYDEKADAFRCPANKMLVRKQLYRRDHCVMYAAAIGVCDRCPLKPRCTKSPRRWITRHLHEGALQRMNARATAQAMRLRRCTVERPFALLKYVIFGHPRFLLRGLRGAQTEISLATLAYNLKTMMNALGRATIAAALS